MVRSSITLPCPGTRENGVVLAATPGVAQFGVGHPANVGDCKLLLVALDENDEAIADFPLRPGESRPWYHPPAGTDHIVAVCSNACHGTAVLEYDTPVG
jgi:hypothetical protein